MLWFQILSRLPASRLTRAFVITSLSEKIQFENIRLFVEIQRIQAKSATFDIPIGGRLRNWFASVMKLRMSRSWEKGLMLIGAKSQTF